MKDVYAKLTHRKLKLRTLVVGSKSELVNGKFGLKMCDRGSKGAGKTGFQY